MNAKHNDILSNLELEHKIDESVTNEEVDWQSFKKMVQGDPTNKKIKSIASKYGYVSDECYMRSWGEPYIQIRSKNRDDYHPEIYFRSDYFGKKVNKFEIQTTSYGSLDEKEYAEYIKCCNDAFNMIKELSKVDLSKLIKEPKEDK
jgi:hypothetical protein